eukprot:307642-Hanusia_phi.AAC.1
MASSPTNVDQAHKKSIRVARRRGLATRAAGRLRLPVPRRAASWGLCPALSCGRGSRLPSWVVGSEEDGW